MRREETSRELKIPVVRTEVRRLNKGDLVMKEAAIRQIKDILRDGGKNCIVLLIGDSGSARFSTLDYLCRSTCIRLRTDSQVETQEKESIRQINAMRTEKCSFRRLVKRSDGTIMDFEPEEEEEKHLTQPQLVDTVFQYANNTDQNAYLIRFLPDMPGFDWFKKTLSKFYSEPGNTVSPVFFSLSEQVENVFSFKKTLEQIQSDFHFNLHIVRCSSNETNIVRALNRVLDFNSQMYRDAHIKVGKKKLDEVIKDIARDTMHNIHLALLSFHIFLLRVVRTLGPRLTDSRLKQLKQEFGDGIFHKIGKVLYNKRLVNPHYLPKENLKDIKKIKSYRYEGEAFDKTKAQFYFKPEDMVDSLHSKRAANNFRLGIQTNYLLHCGEIKDCAKIAKGIARIEEHLRKFKRWSHNSEEDDIKLTVQYIYNFMNNSRYPPPPKVKAGLEMFTMKSYFAKPIKLSNREMDLQMLCPELKILRQGGKLQPAPQVPMEIEDDISSDSDAKEIPLIDRLRKNPLSQQNQWSTPHSTFNSMTAMSQLKHISHSKMSQGSQGMSQTVRFDKVVIEDEIGDIINLSSSSSNSSRSEAKGVG